MKLTCGYIRGKKKMIKIFFKIKRLCPLKNKMRVLVLLFLITMVYSTQPNDPTQKVTLPLTTLPDGSLAIRLKIGSPQRNLVFLLDFQSDVSGVWNGDLLRTSKTFCDECAPVTRDFVYFGPYRYFFELRSISNELESAYATQEPLAYYPPPKDGADGWLALSPRSDLFFVWDVIRVSAQVLELQRWWTSTKAKQGLPFLSKAHRTYPNVPLQLHSHSRWWHRGWLVSPLKETVVRKHHLSEFRRSKDTEWLRRHFADNCTFVLFNNDTRTQLSQRLYNSVFYGANVYAPHSIPNKICLAPGLYLPRTDWYREKEFVRLRWLDIDYLPRHLAFQMLTKTPVENVTPDDLHILSLRSVVRRYELLLNAATDEISLLLVNVNEHLPPWKLLMVILMVFLVLAVFLARPVHLRPLRYPPGLPLRLFTVQHSYTIGYHSGGVWLWLALQAISIASVMVCYWTSDKLGDLRMSPRTQAQVIFWIFAIGLLVFVTGELFNLVLFVAGEIDGRLAGERLRARLFVITQTLHIQTLCAGIWFILIDRSSVDITNLAGALFSLFMVLFCIVTVGIMIDWITYQTVDANIQLWPRLPKTAAHLVRRAAAEPLSFYYALVVAGLMLAWAAWLLYFSAILQIYEMLIIVMSTATNLTLYLLSIVVVLFVTDYSITIAEYLSQLNHLIPSSPPEK